MKASKYVVEVVNVGNELLDGRTVNTNLNWVCGRLSQLGYIVSRATTVRDDLKDIASVLKESLKRRPAWIIVSGGLGPTHDDKTLQAVAKALGTRLVLYEDVVEKLRHRYLALYEKGLIKDPTLTRERLKMARLPAGSKPLNNAVGAAPGVLVEKAGTRIVCLPGVPKELMTIFDNELAPVLEKESKGRGFLVQSITVRDVVESRLAPLLVETMKKYPMVYLKSNPKGVENVSVVVVDFIAEKRHKDLLEQSIQYFQERLKTLT
ncbi:MAG: molybdopterin-binding protein [Candidatus Caldarchaeum sp.]|uniref:Damage-inducible protein CinA n=1 Tax=Caldiarchaeum subterraneum TaxID=311458 RepID=A0A7C5LAP6_CALS0